ncbi:hypothetical protein [Oleomonas cavernae]|uniref:hypothetical protein n=1 Tax=Oleomonas cavernae TaxID=2320859 RepID=UPI0038D1E499
MIQGGNGNDYIQISSGSDTLDGGAGGADLLDCRVWGAGLTVNLTAGTLAGPAPAAQRSAASSG